MAILKVIEIMANSPDSWEDATRKAVREAGKTVKNIKSAYVREHSVTVNGNDVSEFRVNVKISFEVK